MNITGDTVTLTRAEYQDLLDARDHAVAMREITSGAMETLAEHEVDAYLAAATPLAFWRRHRGLTQAALAAQAGIAQPSLAQAETGHNRLSVGTLAKVARALRVRMEDLVAEG